MGFLEIQEGRDGMRGKRYFGTYGTTTACVKRLLEAAVKFDTRDPEESAEEENGGVDDERDPWDFDDIDKALEAARARRRNTEESSSTRTVSCH